jgi:hypothetical protein
MTNGYQNAGLIPYEHLANAMNLDMSVVPLAYTSIPPGESFDKFVPKFEYPPEPPSQQVVVPQRRKPSKSRARSKTLPSPVQNGARHDGFGATVPNGAHSMAQINAMSAEVKQESPKSRANAKGKARGGADGEQKPASKVGKGRASTQGVVVPISNQAREEALADQALKRKRVAPEEPQDNTEELLLQDFLSPEGRSPQKKAKSKKNHHACDRCFRNKTKVSIVTLVLILSVTVRLTVSSLANIIPAITAQLLGEFVLQQWQIL